MEISIKVIFVDGTERIFEGGMDTSVQLSGNYTIIYVQQGVNSYSDTSHFIFPLSEIKETHRTKLK